MGTDNTTEKWQWLAEQEIDCLCNGKVSGEGMTTHQSMPKVWNMRDPKCPKDAVYIGRPSKWGNPFKIGRLDGDREHVIEMFRQHRLPKLLRGIDELRGKDLVCWCPSLPCHGDILLEMANKEKA